MHEEFLSAEVVEREVVAFRHDIDRTLLRENLKLTVEQRLLQLIEQARLAHEFDRALASQSQS